MTNMSNDNKNLKLIKEDLNKRNKEIDCIYKVDEILKKFDNPIEEIFKLLLKIIPQAWRFPEICKIRINYNSLIVSDENLVETDLKQIAPISTEDQAVGEIQLYYIKTVKSEKGIFSIEEQKLLNTIAEKIGNFILYKKLRKSITKIDKEKKLNFQEQNTSEKLLNWLKSLKLSNDEISQFTRIKINFRKNETICKQGAIASYIMILEEGLTKNFLEGNHDKGVNFKIVKPFDFIGLSSMFGDKRYHFSGSTLVASKIFLIDAEVFLNTIKNNYEFAKIVMNWYCSTINDHLQRLSCIANKQALGRIAEILIYLTNDVFENSTIDQSISRKDIAELAGMSTESAVRILSELKNDKIIKITKSGIEITNPKLLNSISLAG
ncbi:MAG: Crp/Fnr family transcriptional regulator [Bacteroidetes bacterium]|nr:Crp/Fnr family transcriptional regulator [Bacteroidota bacterium]